MISNIIKIFLINLIFTSFTLAKEIIEEKITAEERFEKLKKKYDKGEEKKKEKDNSWFFVYFGLGKTVDSLNGEKISGTSSSIGYKKVRNKFIQGYEYNIISNKSIYKATNYKLSFGYKPMIDIKYSPYIEYQFGVSNYEDLNTNLESFGYINSLELGFFLKRFLPIHIIGGTRFTIINYDKNEIGTLKSQELFLRLGFEF